MGASSRSLHFAYAVSTIPVADILAARDTVVSGLALGHEPTSWRLPATPTPCNYLAGGAGWASRSLTA